MHRSNGFRTATLLVSAIAFAIVAPGAAADSVYHTERLQLRPVGNAPLRSGFVLNSKAQGPIIYAHEVYHLNGASPRETYSVTNNFYFHDPTCAGTEIYPQDTAVMITGPSGNARADAFFHPEDVAGFEGVSGVIWTVQNSIDEIVYQTTCTAVTLD